MPYYRGKFYRSKRIRVRDESSKTWKDYVWTGAKWVLATAAGAAAGYYGGALGKEAWNAAKGAYESWSVPTVRYPNYPTYSGPFQYSRDKREGDAWWQAYSQAHGQHQAAKAAHAGAKRWAADGGRDREWIDRR